MESSAVSPPAALTSHPGAALQLCLSALMATPLLLLPLSLRTGAGCIGGALLAAATATGTAAHLGTAPAA